MALFFQTAPPPRPPIEVPPTLRARWADDMKRKDLEDILTLYAPGAEFVDERGKSYTDASLADLYRSVFATTDAEEIQLAQPSHHEEGEPRHITKIFEDGTYEETLRDRATGSRSRLCGSYSITYTKNPAGGWLIARMAWTQTPCPKP